LAPAFEIADEPAADVRGRDLGELLAGAVGVGSSGCLAPDLLIPFDDLKARIVRPNILNSATPLPIGGMRARFQTCPQPVEELLDADLLQSCGAFDGGRGYPWRSQNP
jgi:hypothetical protein